MAKFLHPSLDDICLTEILSALSDPVRIRILKTMLDAQGCCSCTQAAPCPKIAKSTLSNHFQILREAGLIKTTKVGVENRSVVREQEINQKFPGLLKTILKFAD